MIAGDGARDVESGFAGRGADTDIDEADIGERADIDIAGIAGMGCGWTARSRKDAEGRLQERTTSSSSDEHTEMGAASALAPFKVSEVFAALWTVEAPSACRASLTRAVAIFLSSPDILVSAL